MSKPRISIVIPHWKHTHDTIACLESLKTCHYENFDIYVLINGSPREDRITLHNLYDSWEKITILEEDENTGFAEGTNILIRTALQKSKPEYILTLNNDTTITPDALSKAIATAQKNTSHITQLLLVQADDHSHIDKAGIRLGKSLLPFDIKNLDTGNQLFCPSAGAALYSRELLDVLGIKRNQNNGFTTRVVIDYFDSDFFAYAEDFDLGWRARRAGFSPCLAEEALVYHLGSASTGTMSDFAIYHTYRNVLWVYFKNLTLGWLLRFGFFMLIGQLAILIKNSSRGQGKLIIKAWRDAWQDRNKMLEKRHLIQIQKSHSIPATIIGKKVF